MPSPVRTSTWGFSRIQAFIWAFKPTDVVHIRRFLSGVLPLPRIEFVNPPAPPGILSARAATSRWLFGMGRGRGDFRGT